MKNCLSVIVPIFNEEETINKVLQKVLERPEVYEVVIIDDGSTDSSKEIVKSFNHKKIKFIAHKKNLGKGAAIRTGIKFAKGKYLIIQDGDLEYYPSDYPKMLKILGKNQAEFVMGTRWGKNNKRGYFLAQAGNWYLTTLINLLFGCRLSDSYTCYKVGLLSLWKKLGLVSNRFEIEAEIVTKIVKCRYKIKEVPIRYSPRSFAKGKKINWKDIFRGTKTLIKMRFL
ncbi:MAG: glycosyltransferase family 2 protein [Candidatus Daviesbacteria bacterium]|nr:glycosyltransferase family 2 protein [Candidatus Daviesbacteria bacterium]